MPTVERTPERTALIEKRAAQLRKGASVLKWIAIVQPPIGLAILAVFLQRYPIVAGVIGGVCLADAALLFAVRGMLLGQVEEFEQAQFDAAAYARVWERIAAEERRRRSSLVAIGTGCGFIGLLSVVLPMFDGFEGSAIAVRAVGAALISGGAIALIAAKRTAPFSL